MSLINNSILMLKKTNKAPLIEYIFDTLNLLVPGIHNILKRRNKMNLFSKSRMLVRVLALSILVAILIGCGFGASVPWIRNADNNQVVNIGDSIFALSGEIQEYLHSYAGQTFRRYSVTGAEITGGVMAPSIRSQYETARGDDPNIDIIFMDACGNDILIPALAFDPYKCKTRRGELSSRCKDLIDDLYVESVDLLNDMYADGVENVIWQGYYYPKDSWLMKLDCMAEAIDYGDMRLLQACQNSAMNTTFIDTRWTVNDSDIKTDAIHPKRSGSKKLADLMWPVLEPLL